MGFLNAIAQTAKSALSGFGIMTVYAVFAVVAAVVAWMRAKHPMRWVVGLVTVGLVLFAVLVVVRDKVPEIDSCLPSLFLPPYFAWWVLGLTLVGLYTSFHMIGLLLRARNGDGPEGAGGLARYPDLESAWDEIQIRLNHAHYDTAKHKVFLLLAKDEALAASLMRSAGLQFFVEAPVDPNAPVHAYATSDGLFLSCAGASSWGRNAEEGTPRLAELCRKLNALSPEQPTVGGVAVVYPMDKATAPEMLTQVAALRNDLQTLRGELNVRCPTIAVFCQDAPSEGFDQFTARIAPGVRSRRCGFAVPLNQFFDQAAGRKGLAWLAQWFYMWSIKLMADDFHDTEGNSKLLLMNARFWADARALGQLLDVSFSTHSRADPILVRGCYFVACGPDPANHAFVAGLVSGKAGKMIADAVYTSWSRRVHEIDRRYRVTALALGLAAAALALPIWFWGIIGRLSDHPGGRALAWGCLGALALVWVAGLLYSRLRRSLVARRAKPT